MTAQVAATELVAVTAQVAATELVAVTPQVAATELVAVTPQVAALLAQVARLALVLVAAGRQEVPGWEASLELGQGQAARWVAMGL